MIHLFTASFTTILLILLLVVLSTGSGGGTDKQTWKAELLENVAKTNSNYLCFYIRSKLSYQKKISNEARNMQLNMILNDCGLTNVSISDPLKQTLSSLSQRSQKLEENKSHVLIYTHNGFGNQLYQIAFGYLLGTSMHREFHVIDKMPVFMYNPHHPDKLDPNSWSAYLAGREILGISRVNQTWITSNCRGSNITYSERRADKKSKTSQRMMLMDIPGWNHILKVSPRCIILLGYWMNPQWFTAFLPEVKSMFKNAMKKLERYDIDRNDIVVHMRCAVSHYVMLPMNYYDNILQNISTGRIWLAASPSCREYAEVRTLVSKYGMLSYPHPEVKGRSKHTSFLSDFALLLSAYRLVYFPI